MAHALGRVPLAAEVDVFNGEVSGDQDFVAGRRAQDGAVIADAANDGAIAARARQASNGLDQILFSCDQ